MDINLTGLWKNEKYEETVTIVQSEKSLIVIGLGKDEKGAFYNLGSATLDKVDLLPKDLFTIYWTDLPTSKGSEYTIPHKTTVKIVDNDHLKKEKDEDTTIYTQFTNDKKHQKDYGTWSRVR